MKIHSLFGSCLLRIKSHSLCVSVNSLSTTLSDNTTEHLITAERSSDVEDFEGCKNRSRRPAAAPFFTKSSIVGGIRLGGG
ncbi:hypothetical protein ACS0TY_006321 [Phlomoides rotata]